MDLYIAQNPFIENRVQPRIPDHNGLVIVGKVGMGFNGENLVVSETKGKLGIVGIFRLQILVGKDYITGLGIKDFGDVVQVGSPKSVRVSEVSDARLAAPIWMCAWSLFSWLTEAYLPVRLVFIRTPSPLDNFGSIVWKLMTPPRAFEPYMTEPGPNSTSDLSRMTGSMVNKSKIQFPEGI